MNVGFVGLGKLGLPVALAVESKGHAVAGFDTNPAVLDAIRDRRMPYREDGADELLATSNLRVLPLGALVAWADLLFVAVQTPHDPQYEGTTRLPDTRADFDYTYLRDAMGQVNAIARPGLSVAVISTVLPGTMARDILPLCGNLSVCYNPFFIAMGTVIHDFLNPEFVLLGGDTQRRFEEFYDTIYETDVGAECYVERVRTSILNAELIKVTYNTFIGQKIVFGNTVMELCHKLGGDCDTVIDALGLATDRLISPKYLRGGMGDGGGCHPRDNIALSHLARTLKLSHDIFQDVMHAREDQTTWLVQLIQEHRKAGMKVHVFGKAFKADTTITTGSPALLLANILTEYGIPFVQWEVLGDSPFGWAREDAPILAFFATAHIRWKALGFWKGDVVLDPFGGYAETAKDCTYIPIGRCSSVS